MARKRSASNGLPAPREAEVQRAILDLLELLRVPHWRTNAGGGWQLGKGGRPQMVKAGPEGLPDICGWLPEDGRFLGIEVKRPGEKPRPEQVAIMRRINGDRGVAFWCEDVGGCHATLRRVLAGASIAMDESGLWRIVG